MDALKQRFIRFFRDIAFYPATLVARTLQDHSGATWYDRARMLKAADKSIRAVIAFDFYRSRIIGLFDVMRAKFLSVKSGIKHVNRLTAVAISKWIYEEMEPNAGGLLTRQTAAIVWSKDSLDRLENCFKKVLLNTSSAVLVEKNVRENAMSFKELEREEKLRAFEKEDHELNESTRILTSVAVFHDVSYWASPLVQDAQKSGAPLITDENGATKCGTTAHARGVRSCQKCTLRTYVRALIEVLHAAKERGLIFATNRNSLASGTSLPYPLPASCL